MEMIGLIGNPVAHSLSPLMHNVQLQKWKLPYIYHSFQVEKHALGAAVNGMRALGFRGFNVTIPYKVAIMDYLDTIDDEARAIGAVNTVVNEAGKLVGYNTDGKGYIYSLKKEIGESIADKSVLLIGSGGAARAVYLSLLNEGVNKLDVANRTLSKAANLIKGNEQSSTSMSLSEAAINLGRYDLIINTTSIGMHPFGDAIPVAVEQLQPGTIVSDIVYNPLETKWLKHSKQKGAVIHTGVGMFVGQGALAFKKWTGRVPDYEDMRELVIKELGGKQNANR